MSISPSVAELAPYILKAAVLLPSHQIRIVITRMRFIIAIKSVEIRLGITVVSRHQNGEEHP